MSEYSDPPPLYSAHKRVDEQSPLLGTQRPPSYDEVETQPRWNTEGRRGSRSTLMSFLTAFFAACVILGIGFGITRLISHAIVAPAPEPVVPVRVAVIGAGPAGVATAFTLSRLPALKGVRIDITLFEQKSSIGGRMAPSPALPPSSALTNRIHVEDIAGGDLFSNLILSSRASEHLGGGFGFIGREDSEKAPPGLSKVGFWDGEGMKVVTTRPVGDTPWGEWLGQIYKYGSSVWRARKLPTGTMARFRTLLSLGSRQGDTFESVQRWVQGAGMDGSVGMSASKRLEINGVSERYVGDVLERQVRRHTSQSMSELSDLALSIALEREQMGTRVDGIGGRLQAVMKEFVGLSKAEVRLNTKVTGLKREPVEERNAKWILKLSQPGEIEETYEDFDKVILAGPWNTTSLAADQEQIEYRSQCITFFISNATLNPAYFSGSNNLPEQILLMQTKELPGNLLGIQEISKVREVFEPGFFGKSVGFLYRVSSDQPLSKGTISNFTQGGVTQIYGEEIEYAYPRQYPRSDGFGNFKVTDGLWHTGVVEAIGSLVDLSWAAGENVAGLVGKEIHSESKRTRRY